MEKKAYEYWLASLPHIPAKIKILLEKDFGSAQAVYHAKDDELSHISFLTPRLVGLIRDGRSILTKTDDYETFKKSGTRLISWRNPEYPFRLSTLHDAPYAIFLKGKLPDLSRPSVAIVGARSCSPYGKKQAEEISKKLASRNINVISGMALGIDGFAQRSAIENGGYSLAVLGSGIDICYPERHRSLYRDLSEKGGIISEYPPKTPPLRTNFPQRNRLISCLSDAIIVIEAREKSGSLITADFAIEQGREVYALPGPADSLLSLGCHRLIEQGANIYISVEEMLGNLNLSDNLSLGESTQTTLPLLSEEEKMIYSHLSDRPVKLSELEIMTGLSPAKLTNNLMTMQFKGIAREFSLQHYIRS